MPVCRPLSDKEIAERTPQVISCNEALREATLYIQSVGGKQTSKTFRFDRASWGLYAGANYTASIKSVPWQGSMSTDRTR